MDVANLSRAVEQACIDFQVPERHAAAEATLLALRSNTQALEICRYLLQNSSNLQACFQAATALREVALRQWPAIQPSDRAMLRKFLLHALFRFLAPDQAVVRKQLTGSLAAVVKRGWLQGEENRPGGASGWQMAGGADFLQEVQAMTSATGTLEAKLIHIEVLGALVSEFAPDTASTMSMPWDYHEKCKQSLQEEFLQQFYLVATAFGREAASAAATNAAAAALAEAAVLCCNAIMGWDFRGPSHGGRWGVPQYRGGTENLQVRPGPSWRQLLLSYDASDWVLQGLLPALRAADRNAGRDRLLAAARQHVVLLAGLAGDVFPAESAADRAALGLEGDGPKQQYLRRVLAAVLAWISQPEAAVSAGLAGDAGELLDACRAFNAAAPTHRASGFERAVPRLEGSGNRGAGVLGLLAALTSALLLANPDDEARNQAVEYLLEAWVELLQPEVCPRARQPPSPAATLGAATVFSALVRVGLSQAAAGAHEDVDEQEETGAGAAMAEDALARSAALGRVAAAHALQLLGDQLKGTQLALLDAARGHDPSVPLEQMCWLLRLAGHLLADSGQGETPLVPTAIAELSSQAAANGTADPVVALVHQLMATVRLPLDEEWRALISPRLMEYALWASARVADTYLCPDAQLPAVLESAFGMGAGGRQVLDLLTRVATECLTAFPGEVELHRVVCSRLLAALVRHQTVCTVLLPLLNWQTLARAMGQRQPGVNVLAPKLQRALAQQLCLAAAGAASKEAATEYTLQLLHGTVTELVALSRRPDLKEQARQAHVLHGTVCLLEVLRGAVRGTVPIAEAAGLQVVQATMEPLLQLHHAYRNQPQVATLMFKLATEVVDAHVAMLQPHEAHTLLSWVMKLLQQHVEARRGQRALQASTVLADEAMQETYRELKALLLLLTRLTDRDLSELQDESGAQGDDVAQAVLMGLDQLVPLLTQQLLAMPKLCSAYFTLLSYSMEVYPDRVAALTGPQFERLMRTLEWGVQHGNTDVLRQSLEAVAALARFHCGMTGNGTMPQAGLGMHNQPGPDGVTLLARFLQLCMQRLLYDNGSEAVEAMAEALLPLIMSEPAAYQAIGESMLAGQVDQGMRDMVAAALQALPNANGVVASLDRSNRRRFRVNLQNFANNVRAVVHTR